MNWTAFLVYAVSTAASPGPNNIMSMSNGSRKGFVRGLPFNLGILLGFSMVSVICAFTLNALARLMPDIKILLLALGSSYMLYLARSTLYARGDIGEDGRQAGFLKGLLLQFVNPKEYIYCMVSLETFILPFYHDLPLPLTLFALLLAFIGFCFTLLWSAFGSVFRLLFSRHAAVVNTFMTVLLMYYAVMMLLSQ